MGMIRLARWPELLATFVARRSNTPFEWGRSDCCLFVADAVEAMTGSDPVAQWRGFYSSERGAARLMRNNGGVEGFATRILGAPVSPLMAQRGDVVLIDTPTGVGLAICLGNTLAAQGKDGIEYFDFSKAKMAWHV